MKYYNLTRSILIHVNPLLNHRRWVVFKKLRGEGVLVFESPCFAHRNGETPPRDRWQYIPCSCAGYSADYISKNQLKYPSVSSNMAIEHPPHLVWESMIFPVKPWFREFFGSHVWHHLLVCLYCLVVYRIGLVVWSIWIIFPIQLGMSSSQLTFIFFKGVAGSTTNQDV